MDTEHPETPRELALVKAWSEMNDRHIRSLTRMGCMLFALLACSLIFNLWLWQERRYFAAKAFEAQEAHEKTIREQSQFIDRMNATLQRDKR